MGSLEITDDPFYRTDVPLLGLDVPPDMRATKLSDMELETMTMSQDRFTIDDLINHAARCHVVVDASWRHKNENRMVLTEAGKSLIRALLLFGAETILLQSTSGP